MGGLRGEVAILFYPYGWAAGRSGHTLLSLWVGSGARGAKESF